jgi:hypothetical protein
VDDDNNNNANKFRYSQDQEKEVFQNTIGIEKKKKIHGKTIIEWKTELSKLNRKSLNIKKSRNISKRRVK